MNPSDENATVNNLSNLRADVAATTNVLKVTVEKLVQRGDNLDALNNRAEDLHSTSYHFRGTARRVNRNMRWQNYKLTIFLGRSLDIDRTFDWGDLVFVVVCILTLIVLMALHPWKK